MTDDDARAKRLEGMDRLLRVYNLLTNDEMSFDRDTDPEYAVAYAYCGDNNRMSWLFEHVHSNTFGEAKKELPITRGAKTVSCGHWATLIKK